MNCVYGSPQNKVLPVHILTLPKHLICNYTAKRKFLLYPGGISRYHARSPLTGFGHTSHFNDFEKVDIEQYPNWHNNLKNKIEIDLKPGEIIYIPPGWWHQVYNDHSMSINGLLNFYSKKKLLKKPYILFDLLLKTIKEKTAIFRK